MIRVLLLATLAPLLALGQVFPGGVAGDGDLLVGFNRASAKLAADLDNSAATFAVHDGSGFGNNMVVAIDAEAIFCATLAGNTFSGCTRGFDNTTAAAHSSGAGVSGNIVAAHHNRLADEVKAIETALGANLGNVAAADSVAQILTATDSAVDIGNVNDGCCSEARSVTLMGAVLGDLPTAAPATDVLTDGLYIQARVVSSNTVKYYICNLSGAAHDPAAEDYNIQIVRPF